eukprot:CAMPEP_0175312628 /NCGR_PEP_ID=MMETSP0093-20121207/67459_1 /TAXON_ID=311494 /ORGANISM="Alexandrium monilatum, Strain CCMP3105" /LENGTH=176 /DNA_ID=CAMNT_0016609295 /DNA_START=18 /DNA_END=545 /DNA_ORIENTATION=-
MTGMFGAGTSLSSQEGGRGSPESTAQTPRRGQGTLREGEEAVDLNLEVALGALGALGALPRHCLGEGRRPCLLPPLVPLRVPPVARVQLPGGVGEGVGTQNLARRGHHGPVEELVGLWVEEVHRYVGPCRGLAAQGHALRVPTESGNVILRPLQGNLLVLVRQHRCGVVLVPVLER